MPNHFDGTKWIMFDTVEEQEEYLAVLNPTNEETNYRSIVAERIEKGKLIMMEYLSDNAKKNLSFDQSVQQLNKFQIVKSMLEVGNLEDSQIMILNTETDEIFTNERKNKYLSMF